jgi:hypothetical protein
VSGSARIAVRRPQWSSEYLDRLRSRRDQQLKGGLGPGDRPLWTIELDPRLRRMAQLRYANRAEFSRRFQPVETEEKQRRVHEIARHVSGMSREFSSELGRPARFYQAVMERETMPMGFAFDAARSASNYAVFSKDLIDGWDLARISHQNGCIGAANQRKLLCHNDLTPTHGAPRCRQSVPRISLDSHPLKDAM